MNDSKTIQYNRNKLNTIYSLLPKRLLKTDSNIPSLKQRKIDSYRDFKPIKIKTTNTISTDIFSSNNISLSNFDKSYILYNKLFKTLKQEKKLSLTCKKIKKITSPQKDSPKQNKSEKISLKIINDFFKPEISKIYKNKKNILKHKINRKQNLSTKVNKTNSSNNNLCYYFPNLFNVPYNKITSPEKNLNTSRYFFKNLKELKYDENVKNLTLFKRNNNVNENDNFSNSKFNKENIEPIFTEKVYSFNILKNLRFNFKTLVEKGKNKNFINSFYITRNLKFNNK